MIKQILLDKKLTDEATSELAGKLLNNDSFDLLVDYDCDCFDKESGEVLLKFRKDVIPLSVAKFAYKNLRDAAIKTDNRGMSSGVITDDEADALAKEQGAIGYKRASPHKVRLIKKDGTLSKQMRSKKVSSGIIGFFGRDVRFPYCRQTAYTERHWDRFQKAIPLIKIVDNLYNELLPDQYNFQRSIVDKSSKDFVIADTVFTTVTVNKNWQTAVHVDKGDLKGGFGNLCVLRVGNYEGGYFCLPQYKVAVNLNNCDVLLVDVHRWHGNTPIVGVNGRFERISLVMYYRENIQFCGSIEEEVMLVKNSVDNKNVSRRTI